MKPGGWKRAAVAATVLAGLQACSPSAEGPSREAEPAATSSWGRPPHIEAAVLAGERLTVRGRAQPGARVVFRSDGDAYAVVADDDGRFVLPIAWRGETALMRAEIQRGQESTPSPDRLLVIRDGPIAVLRAGHPTRRLTAGPALDAIDVSGGSALLTGRADGPVSVIVDGAGETLRPSSGRWTRLAPSRGLSSVQVGQAIYRWPGMAAADGVEQLESGWRIGWTDDGEARQTTWLPDL